jgi:hypothetical protein
MAHLVLQLACMCESIIASINELGGEGSPASSVHCHFTGVAPASTMVILPSCIVAVFVCLLA